MALEPYSLGELTQRIKNEFGISDADTTQDDLIADKINEAVALIVRRRPNWPWQRKVINLDVADAVTGTCTATQGSRTISSVSLTTGSLAARDVVIFGSSIDPASVYMISATSGTSATLEHQFLNATGTSKALTKKTGFIQLPEDFLRMDTAAPVEDLTLLNRFEFTPLTGWEHLRRDSYRPSNEHWYTVGPDPIRSNERMYMYIYPPLDDLQVLRGSYFADPQRLQDSVDVPMMPRNDRPAVLYYAMNLYAITRSDDRANLYYTMAEKEMTNMLLRYELSDDEPLRTPARWQQPYVDVTTDPGAPDYVAGS